MFTSNKNEFGLLEKYVKCTGLYRKDRVQLRKYFFVKKRKKGWKRRMERNRKIALLLVVLLAIGMLAGCGAKSEEVTLTIWGAPNGADEGYQAVIDAYCKEHSNIKIEFNAFGDGTYESKLTSALSSDMGPDLYYTYGWNNLQTYVDAGFAENLDGKLNTEGFAEDVLAAETVNGSLYGAPGVYASFFTVFYNKDLFAQAGIEAVPSTYDEFIAACDALVEAGITPIAMGAQDASAPLLTWVTIMKGMSEGFFEKISTGAKTTLVDDSFENSLQVLLDWGEAGYYPENYSGIAYDMQLVLFSTEKAAMIMTSSDNAAGFYAQNDSLNIGAFAFPGTEATVGVRSVASGYTLNSASKNKEAAIDFLNYTLTPEAQQIIVDAVKGVPVTEDATSSDALVQEIGYAPAYTAMPLIQLNIAGANDSNPQSAFGTYILDVFGGNMTAGTLVKKMDEVWDSDAYVELFK